MMTESSSPRDTQSLTNSHEQEQTRFESVQYEDGPSYTLEHAINHLGFGNFRWYRRFFWGVGYSAGIPRLVVLSFVIKEVGDEFSLPSVEKSMLGSMSFVGMSIGSSFWGRNWDKFGRRRAFLIPIWSRL